MLTAKLGCFAEATTVADDLAARRAASALPERTAAENVTLARTARRFWDDRGKPFAPGVFLVVDKVGRPTLANRVHDDDLMWAETYNPEHQANMECALLKSAVEEVAAASFAAHEGIGFALGWDLFAPSATDVVEAALRRHGGASDAERKPAAVLGDERREEPVNEPNVGETK
jgi:hypothetical protein